MSVAIIGSTQDAHPLVVQEKLLAKGIECEILDPDGPNFLFSLEFDCAGQLRVEIQTERGEVLIPKVFWWRTKPKNYRFRDEIRQMAVDFAQREWAYAIRSCLMLSDAKVFNDPEKQYVANHKPLQLNAAAKVGFLIPMTVFTNNPGRVPAHLDGVVYKPLTWLSKGNGDMLFANLVDTSQLSSDDERIQAAPCIFQGYIEKRYEVRVSVFGNQKFATRIDSQSSDKTKVDWRRGITNKMYEEEEIPRDISEKVERFMLLFGLDMGMFDFIVGLDGNWVFLECNPAGQWIWLEQATGAKLTDAFVDLIERYI